MGEMSLARVTTWIQTYNRAHLLGETIQSVIDQTFTDQKIIVFDNGSTDNTKEVVDLFSDNRLEYVRNEGNIPGVRILERMKNTDTDYLVVFHDDDKMFPWMLDALFKTLESNSNLGFAASSQISPMGSSTAPPKPAKFMYTLYRPFDYLRTYCKICWNPVVYPSVMYRKSIIEKKLEEVSFRHNQYLLYQCGCATNDFFQSLWLNCNGVEFILIDHPLMEYRLHGAQVSKTNVSEEAVISTWHFYEEFVLQQSALHNLNLDLSRLRAKYAWYVFQNMNLKQLQEKGIFSLVKNNQNQYQLRGNLSILWEKRKFLEETLGWKMTDSQFYQSIFGFLSS